MAKTITVKGVGRATAKPDTVVLSMSLESRALEHDKAMEIAADSIAQITQALVGVGFEKDAVKTTNFNVRTEYASVKDSIGNYRQEFRGYLVSHSLKAEFDLDVKRLSQALLAIATSHVHPQLSISFVIKDSTAINEEMLRSAARNARKKAEVLCEASGATLGSLLSIDYNWGELNICSDTRYSLAEDCMAMPMKAKSIGIEPDCIDISDTVTFVWEINQEEH